MTFTNRDKYGFIIQDNESRKEIEARYAEKEMRREAMWDEMIIQHDGKLPPKSKKLKKMIRKGVPSKIRGLVWFKYSGAKDRMEASPTVYNRMLEKASFMPTDEIDKDLDRTFPNNIYFSPKSEINIELPEGVLPLALQKMRRILMAFSAYYPAIGYCQALNYITGMLLLFLESEEQVFWVIVSLISDILSPNFYDRETQLEGVRIDQEVFWSFAYEKHTSLYKKLSADIAMQCGVPLKIVASEWFLKLFIDTLPVETVLRIWDCLFYEGDKILFRAGLTILYLAKQRLMQRTDPAEIYHIFKHRPTEFYDSEEFCKRMFQSYFGPCGFLPRAAIEQKREWIKGSWSYVPSTLRGKEQLTPIDERKSRVLSKSLKEKSNLNIELPGKFQSYFIDSQKEHTKRQIPRISALSFSPTQTAPAPVDKDKSGPNLRCKEGVLATVEEYKRNNDMFFASDDNIAFKSKNKKSTDSWTEATSVYSSLSRFNTKLTSTTAKSRGKVSGDSFYEPEGLSEFDFLNYYENGLSKMKESSPLTKTKDQNSRKSSSFFNIDDSVDSVRATGSTDGFRFDSIKEAIAPRRTMVQANMFEDPRKNVK